MCTIIVVHRVHSIIPVIVAANRDEFYARTAAPPELRGHTVGGARVVAGRDLRSGGTWLGATGSGVFAAITNQRTWVMPEPRPRSRGAIVGEALEAGSPEAIDAYLDSLEPGLTLPFNLIYGDAERLTVAYGRDDAIERVDLGRGVHVLANDRLGSVHMPKADRARERVKPIARDGWCALRSKLMEILADDGVPDVDVPEPPAESRFDADLVRRLQALCIRTPEYGTVSSTLMALGEEAVLEHCYADGPPGDVPFEDVTGLYR
ncbi:MAG: NRDE family protein [Deltaproteobacteria bacterium]|nr:NRDE family protein [Deltaproteobacteria bacterium]